MSEWLWIETPDQGGQPGQAATRVMRNQMSTVALLAREVVQNSWDAAQPLRERSGHEFSVVFSFKELKGDDKKALVENLSLDGLRERVKDHGAAALGLRDASVLDAIADPEKEIHVLLIEDRGSHGLFGHPRLKRKSHFFKALYTLGVTGKDSNDGGGGSYGFGKTAFIKSSKLKVVFAYSCFEPLSDDRASRRAMGWCWWTAHDGMSRRAQLEECDGRAQLGVPQHDSSGGAATAVPFEDTMADTVAEAVGIRIRSSQSVTDLGTSLLLLEPSIDPADLVTHLETWWWPALVDDLMDLVVINYDGQPLHPKPRLRPDLKPFISAYELATLPHDAGLADLQRCHDLPHGRLALVAEPTAPDVDDDVALDPLKPQVALVRKPRMVVQYFSDFQRKRLPIRGVFVASDGSDPLLRETEPPAHDEWDRNPSDDVPTEATGAAVDTLARIRSRVNDFARGLAPPPANDRLALPQFAKFFGKFLSDKVGPVAPPPPKDTLPVSIRFVTGPHVDPAASGVVLQAKMSFKLRDEAPQDTCSVRIRIEHRVLQDETTLGDLIPLTVKAPTGFRKDGVSGSYMGTLSKGVSYPFTVKSDPYNDLLSVKLITLVEEDL